MPGKKKKGAKKKGGKKKGAKAAAEKDEALKKCRNFLKYYQQNCTLPGRTCSQDILKLIREGIENEKPPVKFVLEPLLLEPAVLKQVKSSASQDPDPVPLPSSPSPPRIVLQPLTHSWVEASYRFVRCLHVWSLALDDDAIVSLALYFESPVGCVMKVLELREVNISPWAINRLAKSLHKAQLTSLNMDYNHIFQPSLVKLCEGLQTCPSIQTLSLNFCQLDSTCGEVLGTYIATSGVREVSLAGNSLTCYGCLELVRPLVAVCHASDSIQTSDQSTLTQTSSEGSEAELKQEALPAPPSLAKLLLQDNCIDIHSSFDTVVCARELKKLLVSSPLLEEINLDGNNLGDGGGREVMMGLQQRKESGLPPLKMTVSSMVSAEIYLAILDLSSIKRAKKKGKKKGKKKKK